MTNNLEKFGFSDFAHQGADTASPVYPSLMSQMKAELVVNPESDVWLIYDRPLPEVMKWIEYDLDLETLTLVSISGKIQDFGMRVPPAMKKFLRSSKLHGDIQAIQITDLWEQLMGKTISVKNSNSELTVPILAGVSVEIKDGKISVIPNDLKKSSRMAWGTTRQLINNAIIGITKGFQKKLEINGVGLRMAIAGDKLNLSLGFSHPVIFPIPADVKMKIEGDKNNVLVIEGINKQRVGQVSSEIREMKKPEPYKGKGIKYSTETVLRKEGKKK